MPEGVQRYAYPARTLLPYADDIQPFAGTEVLKVAEPWFDLTTGHLQIGDGDTAQASLGRFVPFTDGATIWSTPGTATMGSASLTADTGLGGIGWKANSGWTNRYMSLTYAAGVLAPGLYVGDPTSDVAADVYLTRSASGVWTIGSSKIIVGDATAATHAVNRQTGDSRYVQVSGLSSLSVSDLAAPDADLIWPAPVFADGTAAHGSIQFGVNGGFGLGAQSLTLRGNSTDTYGRVGVVNLPGLYNPGFYLGPGGASDYDVSLTRTGAAAASLTGQLTLATGLTMADAKNIAVGATTGTKIGTATTQKLGLWGVTPVAQYSTAGTSSGFTAGSGTAVNDDSTFTGNTGSTAYRISDVVRALKLVGIMAA